MKKIFIMFLLAFAIGVAEDITTVEQTENIKTSIVKSIDTYNKEIIDTKDKDTNDEVRVVYYYDKEALKAVYGTFFSKTGKIYREVYFSGTYPILLYEEVSKYNIDIDNEKYNPQKTKVTKQYYYYNNTDRSLIAYTNIYGRTEKTNKKILDEKSQEGKVIIVNLLKLKSSTTKGKK